MISYGIFMISEFVGVAIGRSTMHLLRPLACAILIIGTTANFCLAQASDEQSFDAKTNSSAVGDNSEANSASSFVSVDSLSSSGKHLRALSVYQTQLEDDRTLVEKLSAARSAWGLGLVDIARSIWDDALSDAALDGIERQRVTFARAIMELQEKNFEVARSMAEHALIRATEPKMRVQLSLLIAESLKSQGAWSLAETYYNAALENAEGVQRDEVVFLLAENQYTLGRLQDARKRYSEVDISSVYAPRALRRLIEIDFRDRSYNLLIPWIEQGRERFSSEFEDAWIRYVMTIALIEIGELAEADKEYVLFAKWYAENNGWRLLAQAALESAHVKESFGNELSIVASVSN